MNRFRSERGEISNGVINTVAVTFCILVVVGLIAGWMAVMPRYRLWKATVEKRILVETARAEADSSIEYARAEVERAKGTAEANRIVAGSLTAEYLRYHYINTLAENDQNVIYIPTEAGLPILEARDKPVGVEP